MEQRALPARSGPAAPMSWRCLWARAAGRGGRDRRGKSGFSVDTSDGCLAPLTAVTSANTVVVREASTNTRLSA